MSDLLTPSEIESALAELLGWKLEGVELVKVFEFNAYLEGVQFVNRLAAHAEERDHHPDLYVGWRKVVVRLSTHRRGGVTESDVQLAHLADAARAEIS